MVGSNRRVSDDSDDDDDDDDDEDDEDDEGEAPSVATSCSRHPEQGP